MKVTIEFNCDNAAFDGYDFAPQIAASIDRAKVAILNSICFDEIGTTETIRDSNGNAIGTCRIGD